MNVDELINNLKRKRMAIKCSSFEETVKATNILLDLGFSNSEYSEAISNGRKIEYWAHPFINYHNIIHYYSSSYNFDKHKCITFDELINCINMEEDDFDLDDREFRMYFEFDYK